MTYKTCTDLPQSKKLAEILPTESADCHFSANVSPKGYLEKPIWGNPEYVNYSAFPCWSLAALLEIIRKPTAFDLLIDGRGYRCHCRDKHEGKFYGTGDYCDSPIDACVEIIEKLHEQKLL